MNAILNLTPKTPRESGHENWVIVDKDLSMSPGQTWYHSAVLETSGIMYPISWSLTETAEGVYDFSKVRATLDYAQTYGKKVILRGYYKSYSTGEIKRIPAYIVSDHVKYGGTSGLGGLRPNFLGAAPAGYTPRFDNPNVISRFHAWWTAMAAEIGNHPALQGMGPDESTWSMGGHTSLYASEGLTTAIIRSTHRAHCLHLQSVFPGKEIYPFYNFCDDSTDEEARAEFHWSLSQGMCAALTDTRRLTDMADYPQQVIAEYPVAAKTLICVDYMSTGADDSGLKERYLENARTTALYGADITAWYIHGGANGNWWAAVRNAISIFG